MRGRLILAAVLLIPVAEVAAWIGAVQLVGFGWAVLGTLATSVLGFYVVRAEGRRSMRRLRETVDSGELSGTESSHGVLRLAGGLALLLPGYLTDLIGLLLVLPPTRALVRGALFRGFVKRLSPEAANRMFGPRRVRARRGASRAAAAPEADPDDAGPTEVLEGEVLEGEVLEGPQTGPSQTGPGPSHRGS
ncbi:MAG: FxsA family protein [Micromonosporaceae bacterium]